jgi:hypothetical protein
MPVILKRDHHDRWLDPGFKQYAIETGFIMLVQLFYALAPRLPKQRLPK